MEAVLTALGIGAFIALILLIRVIVGEYKNK